MRDFDKGKKYGGGGSSKFGGSKSYGGDRGGRSYGGGGGYGGGRSGDRPSMHSATCSDCGNRCEVPFRPTGEKPVFCSDCFKGKEPSRSSSFGDRGNDRGRREFSDRPARPRFEDKKPYQSGPAKETVNYKAQFEILNTKLDKILKAMTIATQGKEVAPKKISKEKISFEDTPVEEETKKVVKKPTVKAKKVVAKKVVSKKK